MALGWLFLFLLVTFIYSGFHNFRLVSSFKLAITNETKVERNMVKWKSTFLKSTNIRKFQTKKIHKRPLRWTDKKNLYTTEDQKQKRQKIHLITRCCWNPKLKICLFIYNQNVWNALYFAFRWFFWQLLLYIVLSC